MINQIKAEQVNLSKGEVTSWEGNKDVLTADVIKDLNTAANAMIKKLINLKEAQNKIVKNQQELHKMLKLFLNLILMQILQI